MGEAVQTCPACKGKLVPVEADRLAYPHFACLGCGDMYFTAYGRLHLCVNTKRSAVDSLCKRLSWILAPIADTLWFPSLSLDTAYRTSSVRTVRRRGMLASKVYHGVRSPRYT